MGKQKEETETQSKDQETEVSDNMEDVPTPAPKSITDRKSLIADAKWY